MSCLETLQAALHRIEGRAGEPDADQQILTLKSAAIFHHIYPCTGNCQPARLAAQVIASTHPRQP